MGKIKILVCTHKPDYVYQDEVYMPIQVGKKKSDVNLGFQGDDTGDSISDRNDWYAELTATYWAWKNIKGLDYIGLCHYRRYFNFYTKGLRFQEYEIVSTDQIKKLKLAIPDISQIFKSYDIVLPRVKKYPRTLFQDYSLWHNSEEMRCLEKVIKKRFPDYIDTFTKVMHKNNKLYHYNMFIMPWPRFQDYCSWIFSVFTALDNEFRSLNYHPLQRRVFGFMGERLMTVYVIRNHLKIKELPLYWVLDEDNNIPFIHRLLGRVKQNLIYTLSISKCPSLYRIFRILRKNS